MRFIQLAFKTVVTVAIFGLVLLIPLKVVPMVLHWLEQRQATGHSNHRPHSRRQLESGHFVHRGQLMDVVWSKALGQKKSELVEAVARLRIDESRLSSLTKAEKGGSVSHEKVREQQKLVEG